MAAGLARPITRRSSGAFPLPDPRQGLVPAKKSNRPKPEAHELAEMWRCAASLERLSPEHKESLGEALLKERTPPPAGPPRLWCLGRLGARVPLYGLANTAVPRTTAERWLEVPTARQFQAGRETAEADLRTLATGPSRQRPRPRSRRCLCESRSWTDWPSWAPARTLSGPFASITSCNPPRSTRPWAIRCRLVSASSATRTPAPPPVDRGSRCRPSRTHFDSVLKRIVFARSLVTNRIGTSRRSCESGRGSRFRCKRTSEARGANRACPRLRPAWPAAT